EHAKLVAAGAADRRAHVEGVELRQLLEILLDEIGKLQQQRLPLEWLDLAPRPLERPAGGGDRTVDILDIAFGDGRQQLAGGGIMRLEFLAGGSVHPFSVDQHLLVGTIRVMIARNRNCLRDSHVCSPFCCCDRCLAGSLSSEDYSVSMVP